MVFEFIISIERFPLFPLLIDCDWLLMGDFGGQDGHGTSLFLRSKYNRVLQPSLCQINTVWDPAGRGGNNVEFYLSSWAATRLD
jgi:hypothetical protein